MEPATVAGRLPARGRPRAALCGDSAHVAGILRPEPLALDSQRPPCALHPDLRARILAPHRSAARPAPLQRVALHSAGAPPPKQTKQTPFIGSGGNETKERSRNER